jgi:hypothetical protein
VYCCTATTTLTVVVSDAVGPSTEGVSIEGFGPRSGRKVRRRFDQLDGIDEPIVVTEILPGTWLPDALRAPGAFSQGIGSTA